MDRRPVLYDDVLAIIFDYVAEYTPGHIHGEDIRRGRKRNVTLAAASRVCKAWTRTAQKALFRDITLGHTYRDIDWLNPPRGEDTYATGDVQHKLQRLLWTLKRFNKRGDSLPSLIRSLHVGVGETDAHHGETRSYAEVVTHGTATQVERLIVLCPGLQHLFLEIGSFFGGKRRRRLPEFSADHLALIAQLPKLRTLTLKNAWRREFIDDPYGDSYDPLEPAQQLLVALAPRITHVNVDLMGDGNLEDLPPTLQFPNLREVSGRNIPHPFCAVLERSATLDTIIQTRECCFLGQIDDLPSGILHLRQCIYRGWKFNDSSSLDYSWFTKLRTLDLLGALKSRDLLRTLKTVPPTVETITIHSYTLDTKKRAARLSAALLRFPKLKQLNILRRDVDKKRNLKVFMPKAACAISFVRSCQCCK